MVSTDITKDAFTIYDTELAKFILIDMAEECGLNILFHTFVSDAIVGECRRPFQSLTDAEKAKAKAVLDANL